jgi:C1A family cysteine protease
MKYNTSGWKRQELDARDYSTSHFQVSRLFAGMPFKLPIKVDLRGEHMPPIVNQGALGSCTANAAAALIDYCIHKEHGVFFTPSRLYQYYNTRLIENTTGEDSGASIRDALKSIAKYGAIPEKTRPYDIDRFTEKPSTEEYLIGEKYQAIKYVLIDKPVLTGQLRLKAIKQQVSMGLPLEFGTPVFDQIQRVNKNYPIIMMPSPWESDIGGHAMVIVGYDDSMKLGGGQYGAFIIRNSWGTEWGNEGYGYLPYGYILANDLASDFWVLVSEEWVP